MSDVTVEATLMDASEGMDIERDVREISALLGCMGVDRVVIMEVFCLGRLRAFASLFGLVHGGAFAPRSGHNLSE